MNSDRKDASTGEDWTIITSEVAMESCIEKEWRIWGILIKESLMVMGFSLKIRNSTTVVSSKQANITERDGNLVYNTKSKENTRVDSEGEEH